MSETPEAEAVTAKARADWRAWAATLPRNPQEANPHREGACPECGAYRTDGRAPYIHREGCPQEGDLQLDRWLAEQQAGDHGGPVLYCTEHDHAVKGQRP